MSIFETAIGWLAPPLCVVCGAEGSAICDNCSLDFIKPFGERCWRCNKLSPASITCTSCRHTGSPRTVTIATSYEGAAKGLVSRYKFGHLRVAAQPIAKLMAAAVPAEVNLEGYLIVPVPTATSRVRERSFGHTELLARHLSHQLKLPYSAALRRLGQARQLGAVREARLEQLRGDFVVRSGNKISGRKILLIDDVLTTGGTLIAATQALRAAGAAKIDALVFAKRL